MIEKLFRKMPCFVSGNHLWNPFYMEHRVPGMKVKLVKYTCSRCSSKTKLMSPKEHGEFRKKHGLDKSESYEHVENAPLKR